MNKIIPFSKDITFNDNIGEITSIALDDVLSFKDKYTINGDLVVRGCHKYGDIEEDFSYKIPVLISVDEKYETEKATISVDDFYYEIINDNILKVKIDLILDDLYYKEDERNNVDLEIENHDKLNVLLDTEKIDIDFNKENIDENNLSINIDNSESKDTKNDNKITDLFAENNSNKEYSIYRVYTVVDGDTIDSILDKYKVTKDDLEQYNDLTKLDIGTKLIIPSSDE